jgi:hypothetical protein
MFFWCRSSQTYVGLIGLAGVAQLNRPEYTGDPFV